MHYQLICIGLLNLLSDSPTPLATPSPVALTPLEQAFPSPAEESAHAPSRLARLTAYWGSEGDVWTARGESATGVHLQKGDCAVDPSEIPYGSVVNIPDVGRFLAVDTGSAVVSRQAARLTGITPEERGALVVDIFFPSDTEALDFASNGPRYAPVTWWSPQVSNLEAREARKLFADEDLVHLGIHL